MINLADTLEKYHIAPSSQAVPELALLYSPPGGGKTYMAATASEVDPTKKTLILDTEGSTVGTLAGFRDDLIDIVRCDVDPRGVQRSPVEAFKFLNTILDMMSDPKVENPYGVVIIDTFDVAQDWAVHYFQQTTPKGRSGEVDGFAVWESVKTWSLSTARMLKSSKSFGILIVHEREEKNQDGGLITKLNLVGSAKNILPGIPDMVVYLARSDGETLGRFESDSKSVTKNRFGLPPVIKNPTFPKLFEFLRKEKSDDVPE